MNDVVLRWPKGMPEEYNKFFLQGMLNRMAVSYHKYGMMKDAGKRIDQVKSLKVRLDKYIETGNTEWLIDVANMAMIEFTHSQHPHGHFRATDSDESPGRATKPKQNVMGGMVSGMTAVHNRDL